MPEEVKKVKAQDNGTQEEAQGLVEWLPLYERPEDCYTPFGGYIVVDALSGRLSITRWPLEEEYPLEYRLGYERWVQAPPETLGSALERFLESERVRALARRVAAGATEHFGGQESWVELNEDAEEALKELEELADKLPTGIILDPWDAIGERYSYDWETRLHYIDDEPVTWERLDELRKEFPDRFYKDGEWYFYWGLYDEFKRLARENEKRLKGED